MTQPRGSGTGGSGAQFGIGGSLVGLLVTSHSKDRAPAPPGKDADPKEYPWYFEWSRTPPGGDRRPPISGGTLREDPLATVVGDGRTQHVRGRPVGPGHGAAAGS